MGRYSGLSILISLLLPAILTAAGQTGSGEIPVVSEFVGTTIDIPEQQYYRIFDNVPGFINAQFKETGTGFKATIRSRTGWQTRRYTAREFYDLGLAVDLAGPIDSLVLIELSGQITFERTVAAMQELPLGVKMVIYREGDRPARGRYQGFEGQYFHLKGRRSRINRVPLDGVKRIRYRDLPQPELRKDVKLAAATAVAGMLAGAGMNRLTSISGFNNRWANVFRGGIVGLAGAPVVMHIGRIQRAEVHWVKIPPQDREKITIFTILRFD